MSNVVENPNMANLFNFILEFVVLYCNAEKCKNFSFLWSVGLFRMRENANLSFFGISNHLNNETNILKDKNVKII